jgi:hypothetical protein
MPRLCLSASCGQAETEQKAGAGELCVKLWTQAQKKTGVPPSVQVLTSTMVLKVTDGSLDRK